MTIGRPEASDVVPGRLPGPGGATPRVPGGTLLADRYELRRVIGRGATADVWEAFDSSLRRRVAVKLFPPPPLGPGVGRLRAEAAAAGRICDASVVSVYDVCETECGDAIILELVDGTTLREQLDRVGRMPIDDVLRIGAGVARALGVVHRAGIVHRDVKPGNVLLVDDRVKLADFGVADVGGPSATGSVVGTPKYVAPEQVTGAPVDPRTDLYSLGAVLYEALAGRPPFEGPDDAATARARLERPAEPLSLHRPDVPPEVEDFVMGLLEADPSRRPESAARCAAELDRLRAVARERRPDEPDPELVTHDSPWVALVVLLLVVAFCVGLAVVLFGRTGPGRQLTRSTEATPTSLAALAPPPSTGVASTPLQVVGVSALDPFGDGGEHDDEAPLLTDGDETTAWETETYITRDFGGLKPGLGLAVETSGGPGGTVRFLTDTPGWEADVVVVPRSGLADPAGWPEPVASVSAVGAAVEVPVEVPPGSLLVLWLTALAEPAGDGHKVRIAEVSAGP